MFFCSVPFVGYARIKVRSFAFYLFFLSLNCEPKVGVNTPKTVIVEELIDTRFAKSRFGITKQIGIWKAGGNHQAVSIAAKNPFAQSPNGTALFKDLQNLVANNTAAAPLNWSRWSGSFAYIALSVDWDR